MRARSYHPAAGQLALGGAALALILGACAPAEEGVGLEEAPTEPAEAPVEPPETPEEPTEAPEEPAEEGPNDDEGGEPTGDAAQLEGETTTGPASADGEFGVLAVTDVRTATHDGFDRVVFQLEGEGIVGWDVRYVDEATSQGSGQPIEVAGDAILAVSLSNLTLPPELPDDIVRWDEGRLEGTGVVVQEVVEDTIFEGIQSFFVGLDGERAFLIERFEDPQRVVIDLPHDG